MSDRIKRIIVVAVVLIVVAIGASATVKFFTGASARHANKTAEKYIQYIRDGKYSSAYNMLDENARSNSSPLLFVKRDGPSLKNKLNSKSCSTKSVAAKENTMTIIFSCSDKNNGQTFLLTTVFMTDNLDKINGIDWDGHKDMPPVKFR